MVNGASFAPHDADRGSQKGLAEGVTRAGATRFIRSVVEGSGHRFRQMNGI